MQRTIFQSPIFGPLIRLTAILLMRAFRWKAETPWPGLKKAVVIAAPHTSNWDLFFCTALCYELNVNFYWMGKHTLFSWPFNGIMTWLGGVPVDRSQGQQAAKEVIERFRTYDEFVIMLPPEGTRKRVERWKKGFYWIASDAEVPIVCGYLDFARRRGGFGPVVMPTGDYEADTQVIGEFYRPIAGKYPDQYNADALLPKKK